MATFLAVLGIIGSLIPVVLEVWRARHDTKAKATKAIRRRDLDELRAGIERVDRLRALAERGKDKPVLPPDKPSL